MITLTSSQSILKAKCTAPASKKSVLASLSSEGRVSLERRSIRQSVFFFCYFSFGQAKDKVRAQEEKSLD